MPSLPDDGTVTDLAAWWLGLGPRAGDAVVLAVEGRSGSGKTTLAAALAARVPDAAVVSMDEIYPGWDGLDASVALLVEHVLRPIAEGRPVSVPRWDWAADLPAPPRPLPTTRLVLVEGIGCGARDCAPYLAGMVWLQAPDELRKRRALARDGDAYAQHWDRWAAQEDAVYASTRPWETADIVVRTVAP